MIITLTIAGAAIAALLSGLIYYKGKYWNYFEISEAAEKELQNCFKEYNEKELFLQKSTEKRLKNWKNKCAKDFKNKLAKAIAERTDLLEKEYKTLAENLEQDFNIACEEVKKELFAQLDDVDIKLEEHARNLASKNILNFSCSCSRDLIPCPIDFSKENTFICPKCNSKYRIAITANPILIGKSISEEDFAELVKQRLNENKETN